MNKPSAAHVLTLCRCALRCHARGEAEVAHEHLKRARAQLGHVPECADLDQLIGAVHGKPARLPGLNDLN